MDPLTILGTCVCMGQLLSSINSIIRSVRGSTKDLQAIASELDSLMKALDVLPPEITSLPQMVNILANCNGVVKQIQKSLRKHIKGNVITGIKWASTGKDGMASLRSSLESHKTSLLALLGTVNVLISTRIHADGKAREAVHTLQYNRVVEELAYIKALVMRKGPLEPRAVASFTPCQLPRRQAHPCEDLQETVQSNKQTVNADKKVMGLENQGKAFPAAGTGQTRFSTIDSGIITPVAVMNAASFGLDHEDSFWVLVAHYLCSTQRFREAENIWRQLWTQLREKNGPLDVDTVKAMGEVVSCLFRQKLLQSGRLLVDDARKTRSENECHDLQAIVALDRHLKSAQGTTWAKKPPTIRLR